MLNPKIAVFMSHYKRPEYTAMCVEALKDAQDYVNTDVFIVEDDNPNLGLRTRVIDFFDTVRDGGYDILAKIDNDVIVPKNWLNDLIKVLNSSDADMLSPNVIPSNAAYVYGKDDTEGKGYRPSEIIGGLWVMKAELVRDMYFERHPTTGLIGAISILKQICVEKEPKLGWVPEVVVEDVGHWSGKNPKHLKTKEHEMYSKEVGRQIAWSVR